MEDTTPFLKYYEYVGEEAGHAAVVGGEVVPGQIIVVTNETQDSVVSTHPDWKASTAKKYEKQANDDQEDSNHAE